MPQWPWETKPVSRTPDFTYIDNDGHVLIVARTSTAQKYARKNWEPEHERLGFAYIHNPQDALVERYCLRQEGFSVVNA